jgi:phosphatidylglycerophosphatase A
VQTTSENEPAGGSPPTPSQRLLLLVGSIGPLGYAPASGTVAVAVAGIPLSWLMRTHLGDAAYLAVTVAFTLAAMAVHHFGDRVLGESDSRRLVWDELAGFFFAMWMVPFTWPLVVLGFLLERAIDIIKVPPANWIDARMHHGAGVVLDDVVAGVYTCILLHLAVRFGPGWLMTG